MRIVAIALVLTLSPCLGRTDEPASKQSNPSNAKPHGPVDKTSQVQPLPAELVAAWEKAGARVGWMSDDSYSLFHSPSWYLLFGGFREGLAGKKGEVPLFCFQDRRPAGIIAKLPQPQTAFGLVFNMACMHAEDGDLKELAGLKNLQVLNVCNSQITDAGLKELAGLKNLQELNLFCSKVTDNGEGVAELQKALPALKIRR